MLWRRRRQHFVSPPKTRTAYSAPVTELVPFVYGPSDPVSASIVETSHSHSNMVQVSSKSRKTQRRPSPSASGDPSTGSSATLAQTLPAAEVATAVSPMPVPETGALFRSDVQGLRTEVENLMRMMQTLNEARFEPPPGYEAEPGQ